MTTPSKADAVKLAREMLDGLEGVTPGKWEACRRGDYADDGIVVLGDDMRVAVFNHEEDAAHAARCHPENIALLCRALLGDTP